MSASPLTGPGTAQTVLSSIDAAACGPTRRDADAGPRLSTRGLRTRTALLASARELFSARGYQSTTVALIAQHAGVSLGTYYQYFADRSSILAELVADAVAALLADEVKTWRVREGEPGLQRVLTSYVRVTAEGARFWKVWEEVTHTDEKLAAVRRDLSRLLTASVARELQRGQRAGIVRQDLNADLTARALTGMVDRYVYVTYFFDPPDPLPTHDESAQLLTHIWARAVFQESS